MDNELEQQAIQTFAAVPEIYQQAFKEAGADFPDELVSAIKSDPNKAVELVNINKDLKQAVIGIFQQNKDAIMQYMQKQTSMFKEGGKFDYLQKLQPGGKLQGDIKPRGLKGLMFEAIKYPREDGRTGYLSEYVNAAGDTTTTVGGKWNSWQRIARKGQKPQYKVAVGSDDYKITLDPEAIEMLNAVHNRFTYPTKKQGGKLAKENEVNKKYIKDSEKAGAKASKEMSDLKAKHKKDIAKLKKK